MQHAPTRPRFETRALIANGATLRATVAAEIAKAQELTWRARVLLRAPYPFIRPIASRSGAQFDGVPLTAVVRSPNSVLAAFPRPSLAGLKCPGLECPYDTRVFRGWESNHANIGPAHR